METCEPGSVIATVTKKRRGNDTSNSANFELSIGDGQTISLNNPSGIHDLDSSMKNAAVSQLQVLQDQMATLMAQLTK